MDHAKAIDAACEASHDAYEAAAATNGWETQEASRKPWADVPEANKRTVRAGIEAAITAYPAARSPADKGLIEALEAVRRRTKNARGAIESNQVVDKDVHGSLTWVLETIDAALSSVKPEGGQS